MTVAPLLVVANVAPENATLYFCDKVLFVSLFVRDLLFLNIGI